MQLHFYGAAQQVTGSMYLLDVDGYRVLIDCGLDYEPDVPKEDNAKFPFDPSEIDVVLLTHAHVDHSGNLPTLFARGFEGNILCTEPTARLADILLKDSANIEARRVNKKRSKKKKTVRLYGHKQVMDVMESIVTVPFYEPFELNKGIKVEFIEAGHILGAASIVLSIETKKGVLRIGFTGDLGKSDAKVIVPPKPMTNIDFLVMESTYGSRLHREPRTPEEVLEEQVRKTCIEQPGRLLIPAFSVGRTQAILFTLNKLYREGKLGNIRIFTDSPLGINSGNIHEEFPSYLNQESQDFIQSYGDLFRFPQLDVVEDREDEEEMAAHYQPCVIVSSAGMMEGGRIQRHVANNIQNPLCTILIAGYCTPGTLGAKLLEGKKVVRVGKHDRNVYARIDVTDVFSAHPDQTGLMQYFNSVNASSNLRKVFLSHGEPQGMEALKGKIEPLGLSVETPQKGQIFELN